MRQKHFNRIHKQRLRKYVTGIKPHMKRAQKKQVKQSLIWNRKRAYTA